MTQIEVYGIREIFDSPLVIFLGITNLILAGLSLAVGGNRAMITSEPLTHISFPDALYLSKAGIAFGVTNKLVPWDKIKVVQTKEIIYRGLHRGLVLEFYIDEYAYNIVKSGSLTKENNIHFLDCSNKKIVKNDYEGVCLRLPLSLFAFETDRQKLTNLLTEKVPTLLSGLKATTQKHGAAQSTFTDVHETENTGQSYTTLWLDQLHSTKDTNTKRVLEVGHSLNRNQYKITGVLGYGGFSVVYSATGDSENQDATAIGTGISDQNQVAIKELILYSGGTRAAKDNMLGRIVVEMDLLKSLNHPNIVKCLDFFIDSGRVYIVMQAVQGKNLRDFVQEKGPLSEADLLDVGQQCCSILTYLHSRPRPVIHRDFTPDNLIWDGKTVKLVDFNVAEEINTIASQTIVGKHSYLSPEQWCGNFTTRGDLYQLGCTLYFLATATDPEPLAQACPQDSKPLLSKAFCSIVKKLTEREENNRFATASDINQALRAVKEARV